MKDGTADRSTPDDWNDARGSGGAMDLSISALVERLRELGGISGNNLCHEAADALESIAERQTVWDEITATHEETIVALRSEVASRDESIIVMAERNAALRAENEELLNDCAATNHIYCKAQAEISRLSAALETIATDATPGPMERARNIARAALGGDADLDAAEDARRHPDAPDKPITGEEDK